MASYRYFSDLIMSIKQESFTLLMRVIKFIYLDVWLS